MKLDGSEFSDRAMADTAVASGHIAAHAFDVPALVVLAGGLGSRFGGDKQTFAFGQAKQPLLYFSAMDAYRAGVRQLVLVVRPAIEQELRATLLPVLPSDLHVDFVLQSLDDLPLMPTNYAQRHKPWGTAQALWAARHVLQHQPFIVMNADDYYGADALQRLVQHCQTTPSLALNAAINPAPIPTMTAVLHTAQRDATKFHSWAMVAYPLQATLSAYGPVNRGLCQVNAGYLAGITEVVQIQPAVTPSANAEFTGMIANLSDTTLQPIALSAQQPVSMNIWLFTPTLWPILAQALIEFAKTDPALHQECYLPTVVEHARQASISIRVYHSSSVWFGVTYPADVAQVDAYFHGQGL